MINLIYKEQWKNEGVDWIKLEYEMPIKNGEMIARVINRFNKYSGSYKPYITTVYVSPWEKANHRTYKFHASFSLYDGWEAEMLMNSEFAPAFEEALKQVKLEE